MQRPKMTPRQGIYHEENQKIHIEFQHFFQADHSRSCIVPLRISFRASSCLCSWSSGLTLGHSHLIMCNYGENPVCKLFALRDSLVTRYMSEMS